MGTLGLMTRLRSLNYGVAGVGVSEKTALSYTQIAFLLSISNPVY
jgi:hypothetical protein